jgi:uncharacterized peroxidase-related enzyme
MNRIHQIETPEASAKTQKLFTAVEGKLGLVPNLVRVLGNSPAALEGYLGLSGALATGILKAPLREKIALAVAEINGCGYCLSAHSLLGAKAGLSGAEIAGARQVTDTDPQADAVLKLARAVTLQRGNISDAELAAARAAGLGDAEIVEVIQHVALNILTNYTNNAARTVIDFPEVKPGEFENETCSTGTCDCRH